MDWAKQGTGNIDWIGRWIEEFGGKVEEGRRGKAMCERYVLRVGVSLGSGDGDAGWATLHQEKRERAEASRATKVVRSCLNGWSQAQAIRSCRSFGSSLLIDVVARREQKE